MNDQDREKHNINRFRKDTEQMKTFQSKEDHFQHAFATRTTLNLPEKIDPNLAAQVERANKKKSVVLLQRLTGAALVALVVAFLSVGWMYLRGKGKLGAVVASAPQESVNISAAIGDPSMGDPSGIDNPLSEEGITGDFAGSDRASLDSESLVSGDLESATTDVDAIVDAIAPDAPNFDPIQQAGETVISAEPHNFAFSNAPREEFSVEFKAVKSSSSTKTATKKRSTTSQIGLQPIQNGNGRYLHKSGAEWQGGWELRNPSGNLKRAEGYSKYLKKNFNQNIQQQLSTRGVRGSGNISKNMQLDTGSINMIKVK